MSAKNRSPNIKIRRLERALRKGRLPAFLDLVRWAQDHGYADSSGQALKLITDDRIVVDSHPLGKIVLDLPGPTPGDPEAKGGKVQVIEQLVPSRLRSRLEVIPPQRT